MITSRKSTMCAIINFSLARIPFKCCHHHIRHVPDPQCTTNGTIGVLDCFADQVLTAQRAAAAAGLPFYLTEFNNGLFPVTQDDTSAAAFAYRFMPLMQPLDIFSWWTFSDIFEEQWMQSAPFHNGFGMMTNHGVRKPVWRAFQTLHQSGNWRFAVTGEGVHPMQANATLAVLATDFVSSPTNVCAVKSALNLSLFVSSWQGVQNVQRWKCDFTNGQCVMDDSGGYTDKSLCNANCQASAESTDPFVTLGSSTHSRLSVTDDTITLVITHDPAAPVPTAAVACRMDAEHTNPLQLWNAWTSPKYLNITQIQDLNAASELVAEQLPITRISLTQSSMTVSLQQYSALYIVV